MHATCPAHLVTLRVQITKLIFLTLYLLALSDDYVRNYILHSNEGYDDYEK